MAGDFEAVFSDRFFNIGDFHLLGIILDHDGAGFDAGRAMVDASHGAEGEFGGLSNAFLLESVDGELDRGATAIGGAGSGVALTGGTSARAVFGGGRFPGRSRATRERGRIVRAMICLA